MQVAMNNRHGPHFSHFFDTGDASQVITAMREAGYDATVAFPSCLLFEEFMHEYPEAKVLLTVRNSADAWLKSASATIGSNYVQSIGRPPWSWIPGMKPVFE